MTSADLIAQARSNTIYDPVGVTANLVDALADALEAAEAERDRLREALEWIRDARGDGNSIARDALCEADAIARAHGWERR